MKQRLLLAFMFSLVWNLGFPQDLETRLMEDFKLDVARANHDTTRINLMWNIISYSQFSNPDTAIMYFEKAYPLAEKDKLSFGADKASRFCKFCIYRFRQPSKGPRTGL